LFSRVFSVVSKTPENSAISRPSAGVPAGSSPGVQAANANSSAERDFTINCL
jgi:hypothetical protein